LADQKDSVVQIAIVLYPGLTALDAIGPYEALRLLPDAEVRFVGAAPGSVVADSGVLSATAAGVSAGLDFGLWLTGELSGREVTETIQLYIEYGPQPPFDAGHPSKASKTVVDNARSSAAGSRSTPRGARSRRSPGSACSTTSASAL
jgi:putative intracellular protease/amidase